MDPNATPKPKLSTEGQIYVTLRAAEEWLAANDFGGVEEARRDLTELLMDAHRVDSQPDQVRYRSRHEGIDLQAKVVEEGRLLVVLSIYVREIPSRDAARARQRARELAVTPRPRRIVR